MDLLKKLTDEFISIYEKSPARLKSKLNSIKALAQCAGNRNQNVQTKKDQEWKPSDMMNMYPDGTSRSQSEQRVSAISSPVDDLLLNEQSQQSEPQMQPQQSQDLPVGNDVQKKQLQSSLPSIETKPIQSISQQQLPSQQQQLSSQQQQTFQQQNSAVSGAALNQNVTNTCRKPDVGLVYQQHRAYSNPTSTLPLSTTGVTQQLPLHNQQKVNIPPTDVVLGTKFLLTIIIVHVRCLWVTIILS